MAGIVHRCVHFVEVLPAEQDETCCKVPACKVTPYITQDVDQPAWQDTLNEWLYALPCQLSLVIEQSSPDKEHEKAWVEAVPHR